MPVRVGTSDTPIPLHFAMGENAHVEGSIVDTLHRPLRDLFDVPDLNTTDDHIVNGNLRLLPSGARPLAPFTAQRIDYSLARLAHYTATSPSHFQNHVLFTNYQFYMDEFVEYRAEGARRPVLGLHRAGRARQRAWSPARGGPGRRPGGCRRCRPST